VAPLVPAGNRALQTLVAHDPARADVMVQRDAAVDTRKNLTHPNIDLAELQLTLGLVSSLTEDQLTGSVRGVPTAAWLNVVGLAQDASIASSLSWAKLSWAKSHDGTVIGTLAGLSTADVASFVAWLSPASRRTMARTMTHSFVTTDPQRAALRACFDAVPNGEPGTLASLVKARFDVTARASDKSDEVGEAFGPNALRRIYNVFESLPAGAIENNPELVNIERYKIGSEAGAGGYYDSEKSGVYMGYSSLTDLDQVNSPAPDPSRGWGFGAGAGSAQMGQNVFDEVVRHEVGHSVDEHLGLHDKYCIGKSAKGGGWDRQPTGSVANDLVKASGGTISGLPADQMTAVTRALQSVVDDRSPGSVANRVARSLSRLVRDRNARNALVKSIMKDPAAQTLQISFADLTPGNPWYNTAAGFGVPISGRITQESYKGEWWSYELSIRNKQSVSDYQFRSPHEWIAEAYNAYYSPPRKGDSLKSVDPDAKDWFDANVDAASGGKGAADRGPDLPDASSGPGFS
jgi:hypothetical protein